MTLDSVDKILDYAIEQEEQAAEFYTKLAGKSKGPGMREAFLGFAEEERGHKRKLLKIKNGKLLLPAREKVLDLKISEQVGDIVPEGELDYQDALIIAMKSEKAAFRMYNNLASATSDPDLRQVLLGLAQEEAKHKLRFEIEYDDIVMKEN